MNVKGMTTAALRSSAIWPARDAIQVNEELLRRVDRKNRNRARYQRRYERRRFPLSHDFMQRIFKKADALADFLLSE